MKRLTCLIIDDERLARRHLSRLVETRGDLEVVGEAADKASALEAVGRLRPELLLLDIQMPGGGGFEILNALEAPPHVIFVTAHNSHAIRAFEVNAVDYLLKPVSPERFGYAVARALQRIRGERTAEGPGRAPLGPADIAMIEIGGSGHFVAVDRIIFIEAEGNYTRVTTADGRCRTVRKPVKEWAELLPCEMFVQLDRGVLLNSQAVISAELHGRSAMVTAGDKPSSLSLGPAAAARLREILPH